jgi:hypothetical protein
MATLVLKRIFGALGERVFATVMTLAAACGDAGPEPGRFEGLWRLTSVNIQPLPAAGNATAGEVWAAAVLQITGETGFFDRCMRDPSTSTLTSRSTPVVVASVSDDRVSVSYFDRRASEPDTATSDGAQLTLGYRNTLIGQEGLDVLTFVPLDGGLPQACSLVP